MSDPRSEDLDPPESMAGRLTSCPRAIEELTEALLPSLVDKFEQIARRNWDQDSGGSGHVLGGGSNPSGNEACVAFGNEANLRTGNEANLQPGNEARTDRGNGANPYQWGTNQNQEGSHSSGYGANPMVVDQPPMVLASLSQDGTTVALEPMGRNARVGASGPGKPRKEAP